MAAASSLLPWPGFGQRQCWLWSSPWSLLLLAAAMVLAATSTPAGGPAKGCTGDSEVWSPEQRAACCESMGIGCSLDANRQLRQHQLEEWRQSEQLEMELHGNRCESICGFFNGRATSCQDRIQHVSLHGYAERPDRCILAHGHVAKWCPHCSGCSPAAAGCHEASKKHADSEVEQVEQAPLRKAELLPSPTQLPANWEAPTVREAPAPLLAPAEGGCSAICGRLRGANATCGDRIREVAFNSFVGEKHACARAYSFVAIRQCPHCSACELKAAGCEDQDDLADEGDVLEAQAAQERREDVSAQDDQTPVPRGHPNPTGDYDCEQGAEHWRRVWSDARQAYCCKHIGIGCSSADASSANVPVPPFNCDAEPSVDWTEDKHIYCCRYKSKGCPEEVRLQQQRQHPHRDVRYEAKFEAPQLLPSLHGQVVLPNLGFISPLGVVAVASMLFAAGLAVRHGPRWVSRRFDSRVFSREPVPTCEPDGDLLGGLE